MCTIYKYFGYTPCISSILYGIWYILQTRVTDSLYWTEHIHKKSSGSWKHNKTKRYNCKNKQTKKKPSENPHTYIIEEKPYIQIDKFDSLDYDIIVSSGTFIGLSPLRYGPLTRYAKWHVSWCMPGSLTRGFLWSRWQEKRSRHSRRMRNLQFRVSGKRHYVS